MIKKILIANRAEIALRIIRACKELEIISAAIYSDADKHSLHTLLADESYYIGEAKASSSYLNKEKIIELAQYINADAIHPGYGFFAENSDFIKTVDDAGIIFIGPSSESVKLMGSKTEARKLMSKNNVPIVPGTTKSLKDAKEGKDISKEIGYPVLLKASAGGGGKGMRKISSEKEFEDSFDATRRESLKAFGSDDVYLEKYIESPRHIEVQIIADKFGNHAHLFERECSIQRRHQKIIEEAPSSFVDSETREKITTAALNAAKACNYYNAGTVEFLMDKDKNFYFLEMNTRLQVEHPVTEMITGIDLVKEQISIAEGNKLSFNQSELKINGHAIESRIYAEDPENNFLPSTGKIIEYIEPSGPGVRIDGGFINGSEISLFYDPLISKVICFGKDRSIAIKKMQRALKEYHIAGLVTNIYFLSGIFRQKDFLEGRFDINYIEREYLKNQKDKKEISGEVDIAALFSAVLKKESVSNGKVSTSHIQNTMNKWLEQTDE